jgi:hypothetical protein
MATTSKEINLWQLDQELAGKGLCADFNDPKKKIITIADNSTVTEAELEEAIKSHIAKPSEAKVIELNREQGLIKLKELGFTEAEIKALLLS